MIHILILAWDKSKKKGEYQAYAEFKNMSSENKNCK